MLTLERRARLRLIFQREIGRLTAPVLIPLLTCAMRWVLGYRIRGLPELRARYRALLRERDTPVLICGNHLTMIDSALITWALAPTVFYVRRFSQLPWNMPERRNFASERSKRILVYLLKCIPIVRGGKRSDVAEALGCAEYLLARGEPIMVFPESGRSRTGRVSTETPAHGVGRLIAAVPGCRVLCVYLRGDEQRNWSNVPARGDTFSVSLSCIEPHSDSHGMRRSHDYAVQVVEHLAAMEEQYFAEQRPPWARIETLSMRALSHGA
jgi:hypothetical protein